MDKKYVKQLIKKLRAEGAKDLGDKEIERCFGECVASLGVIRMAKQARDKGLITEGDLK